MERLAVDTTLLIDLQDERRGRGPRRGAADFLRARPDAELYVPAVALGEYLEGFADPASETAQALVRVLRVLNVTGDVAGEYARTARALRAAGQHIGTNDLWIACTARVAGMPIVTRNVAEFRRVAGLVVVGYAEG